MMLAQPDRELWTPRRRRSRRVECAPPFGFGLPFELPPVVLGAFAPPALSGLTLWTRADLGITLSKSKALTWADQSGNGNHFTSLAATAPTFVISDANMSNGSSLQFAGAQKMNTAAITIAQPNTIVVVCRVTTLSGNPGVIDDSGSRQLGYLAGGTAYAMDAGATLTGGATDTTKHTLVYVFNGASSKLYVDSTGAAVLSGNAGAGSGTGGFIIGTQSTGYMTGGIQEVIVYNRALLVAEINQILAYTAGVRATWTPPKSLTFNGNSIMYGSLASPVTLGFSYLSAAKFPSANVYHDAFAGYTTQQCDAQAADATTGSDLQYSALRANNVDVMLEGLNDYHANLSTPAQCITHLTTYVTNRKAAGANKVVMCTLLPSIFMTEPDRATINTAILGGSTGADATANIGNTSTLMGTYSTTTNSTYYADQTHPTTTGHALLEPIVTSAIASVL